MKNVLAKIFLKKPGQWWFWVLLALVVKGAILIFQFAHADHGTYNGLIGSVGGDTHLYLEPVDNLINYGSYDPDYRMPGYGAFYFFLRFCFAPVAALNLLILLQYLLAALSVYMLALIGGKVFKSQAMFYFTYYLFLISTYSNLEDGSLLSESLCVSFLVFTVYFAVQWAENYKNTNLLLSGLFLTEVIFLKPVYAPLLLLFVLFAIITSWKAHRPAFLKYALIFMLPFILIDGAWLVRNYNVHKRILPLTTLTFLRGYDTRLFWAAMDFMQTWGGNYVSWDPASEMRYFNIRERLTSFHKENMRDTYKQLPAEIYTSAFNADSLIVLKNLVAEIQADSNPVTANQHIDYVDAKFEAYALSVKKENPFVYYVKAPLRYVKIFLIHPGTYNLFPKAASQLSKPELLVKIFYSLFYIMALLLGGVGLLLLVKKSLSFGTVALVTGVLAYTVVIYPLVLRMCEPRYFMPAWPFLLLCMAYALYCAWKKLVNKNNDYAFSSATDIQ